MEEEIFLNVSELLDSIEFIPLNLKLSDEELNRVNNEVEIYKQTKKIDNFLPYTIYEILKDLSSEEQINFLKNNIDYIKKYDNDIFLYSLHAPSPLSSYFDISVLIKLYEIDKDIFFKILKSNNPYAFEKLRYEDFYILFNDYSEIINTLSENEFINLFSVPRRNMYHFNIYDSDILKKIKEINEKNDNFINFILEKYYTKILGFTNANLFYIISKIEDENKLKNYFKEYKDKLKIYLNDFDEKRLKCQLDEMSEKLRSILFECFFEIILNVIEINELIYYIPIDFIKKNQKKYKEEFDKITLSNWIKAISKYQEFSGFEKILDKFDNVDLKDVYNADYFFDPFQSKYYAIKYIENKYRNKEIDNLILEQINENTTIFSNEYINNLMKLKILLKNKAITYSDDKYKDHLRIFILNLKKNKKIDDLTDDNFKTINNLFLKIIKGASLTILFDVYSLEEIALYNRIGSIDFDPNEFSINQIEKYNVKQHKYLCDNYKTDYDYKTNNALLLKLMMLVGFNNAKLILNIDSNINTLEHLVGNVFVKNIKIDEYGNSVLNKKIINLLFNDKNLIPTMLKNKESKLYEYFPRIFNDWEAMYLDNKTNSLKEILEFLEGGNVILIPKYEILKEQFKYLGSNSNIKMQTINLYENILKRVSSTIPRIKGNFEDYTYEILKLDDLDGITIGNKTKCCFTVLGNAYSSLKHALTNIDGRILEIKKEGKLIAQSWLWRNGNTLCIDNIEIVKSLQGIDFIDIYIKFANHIVNTSNLNEPKETSIKNVTLGYTNFDKPIKNIDKYLCYVSKNFHQDNYKQKINIKNVLESLPQPSEIGTYTDSKNVQIILHGLGDFKYFNVDAIYKDSREDILHYNQNETYEEEYIDKLEIIINALRYRKAETEEILDKYKKIKIKDYDKIYCNKDWYIMIKNNEIESYIYSFDDRAYEEMEQHKNIMEKKLVKVI